MAYSVFISYSSKDLATATSLKSWIEHAGAEAFCAEYAISPGQRLTKGIETALRSADLFVLLWSQNAAQSAWVPQEIGFARGLHKPILPVVLHEGVTPPAFIEDLKYLALYPDPNAAVQQFYSQIADRIRKKESSEAVAAAVMFGLVLAGLIVIGGDSGAGTA